jgi:hypothetical protein
MDTNDKALINPPSSIKDKFIDIADSIAKSFHVIRFPATHLRIGWMKNVLSFPSDFLIALHAERVKEGEVIKTIERKKVAIDSYKLEEMEQRKMSSIAVDVAKRSVDDFLNLVASSNESIFKVGIRATVFGKSEKEVENAGMGLSARFGSIILHPLNFRQKKGLISTVPIGQDDLEKTHLLSLRGLAGSLPVYIKEFQMKDGIVYGINPDTHSLVKINEWDLPNPHVAILGPTGFGKSFFMKALATRSYMFRQEKIFIIDQQGEYELVTDYLGGTFIDRTSKIVINPFDKRGEDIRDTISFVRNFIFLLLNSQVTQVEVSIIEKALFSTYEKNPNPIFSDFIRELEQLEGGKSISVRLMPYYAGTFAPYFNGHTNINVDNSRLITFNYSNSAPNIRSILVFLDFNWIMKRAFDTRERTRLFIDEGWSMLANSIGAESVRTALKTGRKYNLSVVFATQQISDIAQSAAGKSVLEEPTIKYITTQNETTLPLIQNIFMLNEEQVLLLQRMGRGAGLLMVGDEKFPLSVIASKVEYVLFDTRPEKMKENLERWKASHKLF